MKILFIAHYFQPEPGFFFGLPFAEELTRRGHQVEILTAIIQKEKSIQNTDRDGDKLRSSTGFGLPGFHYTQVMTVPP